MDRLDLRDLVIGEIGDFVRSREAMGDGRALRVGSFSTLGPVRDWRLGSSKLAMSVLEDSQGYRTPSSCLVPCIWFAHNVEWGTWAPDQSI